MAPSKARTLFHLISTTNCFCGNFCTVLITFSKGNALNLSQKLWRVDKLTDRKLNIYTDICSIRKLTTLFCCVEKSNSTSSLSRITKDSKSNDLRIESPSVILSTLQFGALIAPVERPALHSFYSCSENTTLLNYNSLY
jgi:hypothetical protein